MLGELFVEALGRRARPHRPVVEVQVGPLDALLDVIDQGFDRSQGVLQGRVQRVGHQLSHKRHPLVGA